MSDQRRRVEQSLTRQADHHLGAPHRRANTELATHEENGIRKIVPHLDNAALEAIVDAVRHGLAPPVEPIGETTTSDPEGW